MPTYCAICGDLIITREDGTWIHTTIREHDHPATPSRRTEETDR